MKKNCLKLLTSIAVMSMMVASCGNNPSVVSSNSESSGVSSASSSEIPSSVLSNENTSSSATSSSVTSSSVTSSSATSSTAASSSSSSAASSSETPSSSSSSPASSSEAPSSSSSSSSSVVQDKNVVSIKIVEGSISTKLLLNAEVSYSNLKVEAFNKAGEVVGTLSYSKNPTIFAFDAISTATEIASANFTVTVTINGHAFTDSVTYSVAKTYDLVAASIVIQGVSAKYYVGDELDLASINISILNKDGIEINSVKGNDSSITVTGFESKSTGSKTLTVTYQTLTKTADYQVLEAERRNTPTNWEENAKYTAYKTAYNSTSSEKDGQHRTSFMEKDNFYLGNYNGVNLMPVIHAINPSDSSSVVYANMYGVEVKLYQKGSTTALNLNDYFEASDVEALKNNGVVNFKDAVVGDFTLTFIYPSTDKVKFPNISYDLDVVDGYNVNTVKDLIALDNTDLVDYDQNDLAEPKDGYTAFKTANNLPQVNFKNGIIQADLSLTKEELPSSLFWTKEELAAGGGDVTLEGSFKDYNCIVNHRPSINQKTFSLYGNYHKISLSELPDIETAKDEDTQDGKDIMVRPETGVPVEPHSALFESHIQLFYTSSRKPEAVEAFKDYKVSIKNLSSTGNQAVSSSADYTKAGLSFYKGFEHSEVENCILGQFYVGLMSNGMHDPDSESATAYVDQADDGSLDIKASRVYDTFNCSIFNYKEGTINISDSEIRDSGGPLVINQGNAYTKHERDLAAAFKASTDEGKGYEPRAGAWVNIDTATKMENYVTGEGGWFKINNAESQVAGLTAVDPLFNAQLGKTMLNAKTTGGTKNNVNLLVLNMLASSTSDATTGGFYGRTTIGTNDIVNYESGRSELEAAILKASSDLGASYSTTLGTSDYSSLFLLSNAKDTPVFKTEQNGVASYATVYSATPADTSTLRLTKPAYNMTANPVTLVKGSTDFGFGSDEYMTIYTGGTAQGADPSNPANYGNYGGANCFGLVVTLADYSA